MPRPEGTPKTGGRKKGTPNRRSMELADQLEKFGLNVPEEIVKLLPELDVQSRSNVLMELMTFLFPKRKAIEHSGEVISTASPDEETPEEREARKQRVESLMKMHVLLQGR